MAARFWVGGTGTWDATAGTKWATTSGGAGGAAVPTSADDVTFDNGAGASGTVTVNTTVNVNSITFNTFVGTLDFATNNNNVTINVSSGGSGFVASGAGTRTLNMGNGTWTMAGNDALFTTNNAALTLNANSSTISFTGAGNRNFEPGGKTFNIVSFAAGGTSTAVASTGSTGTIGTLNIAAPNIVKLNQGGTTSVTTLNVTGTSSSAGVLFMSSNVSSAATMAVTNNFTGNWIGIGFVNFTVGTHSATNSFKYNSTTGITVTGPSGGGSSVVGVIGS